LLTDAGRAEFALTRLVSISIWRILEKASGEGYTRMDPRRIAKRLLPPIVVDTIRTIRAEKALHQYLHGQRTAWSRGYWIYWEKVIAQSLRDESLLRRFRQHEPLPSGYGIGIDERCIEYPWLLAHLQDGRGALLDAGSTLNHDFILDHPMFQSKLIHILTLAPEWDCFWQRGISYLFHDLRNIPIRDAYYDTIACLSTLEHIGCDNMSLTHNETHREHRPESFVFAMQEFRRVLKPGCLLFLTVPFGIYRDMGVQQQFDRNLLSRAVEAFGKANEVTETFYRYSIKGWNVADSTDCAECEYVESSVRLWTHKHQSGLPPVEPDLATAARAVACVKLVKG
jgi:SAM-dependent methyltransferase